MKLVYIAGPFTPTLKQRKEVSDNYESPDHISQRLESQLIHVNIARAVTLALRVAESGHMPVCPHSNTGDPRFLSLQTPEFWYAGTLELLRRCDAIALTDDWSESNGACREVIDAKRRSMTVWRDGVMVSVTASLETLADRAVAALRSRGQEP